MDGSRSHRFLLFALVSSFLLLHSAFVFGTAPRTFVASNGVDTGSCSLATPCRSFAAAIAQTSTNGEIIVLDSAGYGPVTITKSVSIIAPPGIYGGITVSLPSGDGVTINAPGGTVVLRGLSISGQSGGNGIRLQQAARVRVESCVVSNTGAVGIDHRASGAELIVLDTIVRDTLNTGIAMIADDATITLDHVRSEHNQNSGFYMSPTAGGVEVRATINDSVFVHNGANGIWADTVVNGTTSIDVERTVVSDNTGDGFRTNISANNTSSIVVLKHNAFIRNGGNGVLVMATFGQAYAMITDNSTMENGVAGLHIDGQGTGPVLLSQNAVLGGPTSLGILCTNDANPKTYGNNAVSSGPCPKRLVAPF